MLPYEGGTFDQPADLMAGMNLIGVEVAEAEKRRRKREERRETRETG